MNSWVHATSVEWSPGTSSRAVSAITTSIVSGAWPRNRVSDTIARPIAPVVSPARSVIPTGRFVLTLTAKYAESAKKSCCNSKFCTEEVDNSCYAVYNERQIISLKTLFVRGGHPRIPPHATQRVSRLKGIAHPCKVDDTCNGHIFRQTTPYVGVWGYVIIPRRGVRGSPPLNTISIAKDVSQLTGVFKCIPHHRFD